MNRMHVEKINEFGINRKGVIEISISANQVLFDVDIVMCVTITHSGKYPPPLDIWVIFI